MWCLIRQTRKRRVGSGKAADALAARLGLHVAYSLPPRQAGPGRPYFLENIVLRRMEYLAPFDTILAIGEGEPPSVKFRVRREAIVDARREEQVWKEYKQDEGWKIISRMTCPNASKARMTRFFLEWEGEVMAAELEPGDEIRQNLGPAEPDTKE